MSALVEEHVRLVSQLRMPDSDQFYTHIMQNAAMATRMATHGTAVGQRVAICGAGPSLRETASHIPAMVDQVWACNSALPYLMDRAQRVTHGFAIDQGVAMLAPHEWGRTFAVDYLLASSVSPLLVQHLHAASRPITFFHSYIGLPSPADWVAPDGLPERTYEMWLYTTQYPTSVQVGHGLNAVPRAVCLALAMGFSEILVYGADCACAPNAPPMPRLGTPEYATWLEALVMYPDGRTAAQYGPQAAFAEASIDGTRWHTRPDMAISASMLVELAERHPQVRFIGEGLPGLLMAKDATFRAGMPRLVGDQVHNFGAHVGAHPEEARC